MAWLALALAVVGCGSRTASTPATAGGPPVDAIIVDAGPLERDLPRLAQRSIELYQAIVEAFAAASADCAVAATRLRALRAEYAEVVAANATVLQEGRGRELGRALAPLDVQFDAAAQQIVGSPTLAACVHDEPFAQAYDELLGSPP
ncbi:MAG: hypothetical protein M3680_20465 [Myxococcota bacterium]|nr:hypothetical protein [Myxococcota bacterium]